MIAVVQMGDDQGVSPPNPRRVKIGTQHKVSRRNKDLGKARSANGLDEKQIARAHDPKGWEEKDPQDLGSCCSTETKRPSDESLNRELFQGGAPPPPGSLFGNSSSLALPFSPFARLLFFSPPPK